MMREDFQQKPTAERPLSTATLAQADETRKHNHPAQDRMEGRGPDSTLRQPDRPPADGGPMLVAPASRPGKAVLEQNSAGVAGNRDGTQEEEQASPLFSEQASKDFFARWDGLQVGFIDEPRRSVEQADNLVASAMKRLAEIFAEERAKLEGQWDRGDNVSTEDLRIAMRRYRSFFRRLLAV